jgi:hypothetical protein
MDIQVAKSEWEAKTRRREFICGFAKGARISPSIAETAWADYTQFLTKAERRIMEIGGQESGKVQGDAFRNLIEGLE